MARPDPEREAARLKRATYNARSEHPPRVSVAQSLSAYHASNEGRARSDYLDDLIKHGRPREPEPKPEKRDLRFSAFHPTDRILRYGKTGK
jgi:hypothetical protein